MRKLTRKEKIKNIEISIKLKVLTKEEQVILEDYSSIDINYDFINNKRIKEGKNKMFNFLRKEAAKNEVQKKDSYMKIEIIEINENENYIEAKILEQALFGSLIRFPKNIFNNKIEVGYVDFIVPKKLKVLLNAA